MQARRSPFDNRIGTFSQHITRRFPIESAAQECVNSGIVLLGLSSLEIGLVIDSGRVLCRDQQVALRVEDVAIDMDPSSAAIVSEVYIEFVVSANEPLSNTPLRLTIALEQLGATAAAAFSEGSHDLSSRSWSSGIDWIFPTAVPAGTTVS